ncbi:nuclear transport factor 2 family protein [Rhodococcoides yunnanense]|uniref:nuclear transport factor 2 family protein n=1 Tax=Rhodococcoides yunnanense TaxID=278209 RepID=UPI0009349D62|nr:nuclear transport factor 2 family protein [Rhodococcus yunnanensis]
MSKELENKVVDYLQALERTDWQSARSLCAADATVWHNDGKGDETLDEYFDGLKVQIGLYQSIRYDIIRQLSQAGGVLQQHVVRVVAKNGERGGVHAAVYFGFDETDKITRIEAYANYIPE